MPEWKPQPKQEQFMLNQAYENMFGGAKGPGKSDALLIESMRQIGHPRYKGILYRRTYPKLEELIIRSHSLWFDKAKWSGRNKSWLWPSGAIIRFNHCQNEEDKYNIQGHEYQFMGFDQIEEFTQTQYEFLILQCRTSQAGIICYIRATANPGNVGHMWVKNRFVDKCPPDGGIKYFKMQFDPESQEDVEIETDEADPYGLSRSYIFSTVDDNKILLKNDPKYLARLEAMPDPYMRRALRYGDWDAFVGQYFSTWRRQVHVIPYSLYGRMIQEQPVTRYISVDYGMKKPASVGWYALFPDGNIIRYRELYKEGLTYEALAHKILEMTPSQEKIEYVVADPSIQGDKMHHKTVEVKEKDGIAMGESGLETMREVLISRMVIILGDNRRVVGWGRVFEYLETYLDQHNQETAMLRVTSNCKDLIRTLPACVRDETKPEDLDSDGEDHAADELRYFLMSRQTVPKAKPAPITISTDFWDRVNKDIKRSDPDRQEDEIEEELELAGEIISD